MLESAGILESVDGRAEDTARRRRIIREMKRRHPQVHVEISLGNDGREQWRVNGDQSQEAEAIRSLRELLKPDSVVSTTDPFEVPKEEVDELEIRMEERGGLLELP
jgi:hypothetical protein